MRFLANHESSSGLVNEIVGWLSFIFLEIFFLLIDRALEVDLKEIVR